MEDTSKLEELERLIFEKKERLKELACINKTTQIVREGKGLEETLSKIVKILPEAWQYPEMTSARIRFKSKEYKTANFWETEWKQSQTFHTISGKQGDIEVFYLQKFRDLDEGPFMKEERDLINNLSMIIQNYIDSFEAREVITESKEEKNTSGAMLEFKEPRITGRHLLQRFLNKQNANRDIFHDLMPFRVKDILLVATLYDAFSIEKEGRFGEHILGEYQQLHLSFIPKVTGVTSFEEAIELLRSRHFDLVILMIGNDIRTPLGIAGKVKKDFPYIPIYVLLNNEKDIPRLKEYPMCQSLVDQLFVWSGDSKIFFAMVKHLEDKVNVDHDTRIGLIKLILLVEDSPRFYSRYLPFLYTVVMEQTQRLIDEVSTDDIFKILRRRARPKILLATNYEQALNIVRTYGEDLLCLITDVRFEKDGIMNDSAGLQLVLQVHSRLKGLPVIIQSTDNANMQKAFELKAFFINKNSESLRQDIESFIKHHLGFGNIIYRDSTGKTIAEARSLKEFEEHIDTLPIESLIYHGKRNHFSLWLMARGEIKIAKMLYPVKVTDFQTPTEFRNYLKFVIRKYRNETDVGKVLSFEDASIPDMYNIVSIGSGALGGKGRGLAFVNSMIYNLNFAEILPSLNIRTPVTLIIGTDEFEIFMQKNNLYEISCTSNSYDTIKDSFLAGELSYNLEKKLRALLKTLKSPLAVRSSSSLEDSIAHPFSGIFTTYIIPNNHPDFNTRLKHLMDAIKLVYASVFSDHARSYFEAVNFRIEDEKMAVVLQELVGNSFGDYYYPHISGTAQSYNYYPFSHMKPEDGFAVIAVGLGQYVMEGEKAYRFSPKYPDSDINTPKELLKSTQVHFYALNMKNDEIPDLKTGENATLASLEISEAENHGTINHSVSIYDINNDRIYPGLDSYGPRIVNFANILKYEHIPLAKAIELILDVGKEAMGSPVEIEFAVDMNRDENGRSTFYLLQIKPLLGSAEDYQIDQQKLNKDKIVLLAEKSMGNGKIDDITDVIYVDPDKFDKTRTCEMVVEIDRLNYKMRQEGKKYILIGPGRWGTRDRFIGIPVAWPQISNAKVIVETSLEDFPLDASLGSHFFHNVTSMNVGYFTIQNASGNDYIHWDIIRKQRVVNQTGFFNHIRFNDPLTIVMDGKKRMSVIMINGNSSKTNS